MIFLQIIEWSGDKLRKLKILTVGLFPRICEKSSHLSWNSQGRRTSKTNDKWHCDKLQVWNKIYWKSYWNLSKLWNSICYKAWNKSCWRPFEKLQNFEFRHDEDCDKNLENFEIRFVEDPDEKRERLVRYFSKNIHNKWVLQRIKEQNLMWFEI